MKESLRPIQGRVLVEPVNKEPVSKGGIYIPDSADSNAKGQTRGRIITLPADVDEKLGLKVGMVVFFNKFAYSEIRLPALESGQQDRTVLLVPQDKLECCVDVAEE